MDTLSALWRNDSVVIQNGVACVQVSAVMTRYISQVPFKPDQTLNGAWMAKTASSGSSAPPKAVKHLRKPALCFSERSPKTHSSLVRASCH